MNKVEEKALDALDMYAPEGINEQVGLVYTKSAMLGMFKDGYHQAEKDNELTWEDVHAIAIIEDKLIHELCLSDQTLPQTQEFYIEVLKRFNKQKGK